MPSSRHARSTRTAISPRLATSSFLIFTRAVSSQAVHDTASLAEGLHRGLDAHVTPVRSEEHTSELQSRPHLVCRLLLEKKTKPTHRSGPTRNGGPVFRWR